MNSLEKYAAKKHLAYELTKQAGLIGKGARAAGKIFRTVAGRVGNVARTPKTVRNAWWTRRTNRLAAPGTSGYTKVDKAIKSSINPRSAIGKRWNATVQDAKVHGKSGGPEMRDLSRRFYGNRRLDVARKVHGNLVGNLKRSGRDVALATGVAGGGKYLYNRLRKPAPAVAASPLLPPPIVKNTGPSRTDRALNRVGQGFGG